MGQRNLRRGAAGMRIIRLGEKDVLRWDQFVPKTAQGVFLQSRRFLAYHGNRFKDISLLIENDKGQIRALFPAAESADNKTHVVSHPGITYGGLLHDPGCRADEIMEMVAGIRAWYREHGYRSLIYKAVPHHVQRQVVQADLYALWREGGMLVRRDLWNVLDLGQPRRVSKGHNWGYKRAIKSGLSVNVLDDKRYVSFHEMLVEGLMERHDTQPVHALEEFLDLQQRFPEEIQLWGCQTSDGELIAGLWLFKLHPKCWHTQYIIANAKGRELFATDLLLEELINRAQLAKVSYFSFGCSTEDGGLSLNAGLFSFKAGFGAGAVVQDFYEVDL